MYQRTKFVTNSSSTSVIGWGAYLSREEFNKIEEFPEGVDYARPPSDDYIVFIPAPIPKLDENGVMSITNPTKIQKPYQELKALLESIGAKDNKIGYVEESWYDG